MRARPLRKVTKDYWNRKSSIRIFWCSKNATFRGSRAHDFGQYQIFYRERACSYGGFSPPIIPVLGCSVFFEKFLDFFWLHSNFSEFTERKRHYRILIIVLLYLKILLYPKIYNKDTVFWPKRIFFKGEDIFNPWPTGHPTLVSADSSTMIIFLRQSF